MSPSRSIRIVIADDHSVVREGLVAMISREPDMQVVGQASNWPGAGEQAAALRPEIVIVDLHMPGMEPSEGAAALRQKCPTAQMIIFSAFGTDEEVYRLLCAGARGYVLKGESGREDLVQCVRAVARGEMWIHPSAAARLAQRMTAPTLTSREKEVLQLMAGGKSNKEIGSSLDVTEGTVKVHVNHILSKLGVGGRVEAITVALQRGFVRLAEDARVPRGSTQGPGAAGSPGRRPAPAGISKAIDPVTPTAQLRVKK
jgi:two-component system NarL family response regulator